MIRVVIIGTGFPDWSKAIFAGAPVWARLSEVGEVVQIPSAARWTGLPAGGPDDRTVVIPLMEEDVRDCIRHPELKSLALLPTERALLTLYDKARFSQHMLEQGLGEFQPELFRHTHELKFPVALKRTTLNAGSGIARADNLAQFSRLSTLPQFAGKSVLACEWIEGRVEYVTHAVVVQGHIRWHQSFEYGLEPGQVLRRGSSGRNIRPIEVSAQALRMFEAVLLPLNYCGICNIDFKLTPQGRLKIFEINPRLGGSLLRTEHIEFLTKALRTLLDPGLYPTQHHPTATLKG
jgi:hypothetical protein